ncbi:MAG: phosphopyruvate hydratase [Holosporales bacterium]|jgi:enolase|nr:phosphopyruvate hydratase [Holosporales bacterium]
MYKIERIKSREILDSRGIPTIETDVFLSEGEYGRASVPSGASTGSYEAVERRDTEATRYLGKGVAGAIQDIDQKIAPALIGQDAEDQRKIDSILCEIDGSANKRVLGANAILAVSLACARAVAKAKGIPLFYYLGDGYMLPMPLVNVLNGGAHADNNIDVQEFMLVPTGAHTFSEATRMCAEVFYALKLLLKRMGHNTNVGDEGGVAPNLSSASEALDILLRAIEFAGYHAGRDITLAMDVAASELFDGVMYKIENNVYSSDDMISYYEKLIKQYPIVSIEDGLAEDDWDGWRKMTQRLQGTQIVGDDLFVTNSTRLQRGLEEKSANAILIKLNQIGTLTETLDVIRMAQANGLRTIISHRSGETNDAFISDLSVAVGAGQIKTGSTSRGERLAKYNQLLRIEECLEDDAEFSDFGKYTAQS